MNLLVFIRAACFAPIVLALAVVPAPAQPVGDSPSTVTVTIHFDPASEVVSVSPDTVRVDRPGIRIEWIGAVESWHVRVPRGNRIFGRGTGDRSFRGGRNRAVGAVIVPAARRGTYKYDVIVEHEGRRIVLDPEIIVLF